MLVGFGSTASVHGDRTTVSNTKVEKIDYFIIQQDVNIDSCLNALIFLSKSLFVGLS